MVKRGIGFLLIALAAFIGVATAQNSKVVSSSTKSGADPLKTATKPLTLKSAIVPHSPSSAQMPNASANGQKTNAELTRLEHQNIKVGGEKSGNTGAAKGASIKPSGTTKPSSSSAGSGINSSYQKPNAQKN
jgi:hypothetical protein